MVERARKPGNIAAPSAGPQPTVNYDKDTSLVTAKLPSGDSVEVLLHGATVISWKSSKGQENLWLSEGSALDGSAPVRGGIPLVFPVFGPPPKDHTTSKLPQHGFARRTKWEFLGKSTSESNAAGPGGAGDDSVKLDFGLSSDMLASDARAAWPYDFGLTYSVTLSAGKLQTMLHVRNTGQQAFEFNMLLHSYFRIKDISTTSVTGLLGTTYVDKVLDASTHTQAANGVTFAGEVDRVYSGIAQDTSSIVEADGTPRFDVVRDNLTDTVVWNPWTAKAAGMKDFAPKDGWKNMVCVEVGAVSKWQKLEPLDTFEAGQIVRSLL